MASLCFPTKLNYSAVDPDSPYPDWARLCQTRADAHYVAKSERKHGHRASVKLRTIKVNRAAINVWVVTVTKKS